MARLSIKINSPTKDQLVNRTISVTGKVDKILDAGEAGVIKITEVTVQFGASGRIVTADVDTLGNWNCSNTIPVLPDPQLKITASALGTFEPVKSNDPPDPISSEPVSITVKVEAAPIQLAINQSSPIEVEASTPTYTLRISGTAKVADAAIAAVQYRVRNEDSFVNTDNPKGNWSDWLKDIDLAPGNYQLTIQALDTAGGSTSQMLHVSVKKGFETPDIDKAFASTTYLQELLKFAARHIQIKTGETTTAPSAQVLAGLFFQPFDKLTASTAFEQASLPLHQARIAIEVLRRRITPPEPPELDQRFRLAAYQALLRELGTSYEELRLARMADIATRQALAERIGIGSPDRLDQMTFLPDAVTDAQLAEIFGYRSTAEADPLRPPTADPLFLVWRLDAQHKVWVSNDAQTRDGADGPLPIIDPDLIDKDHIKSQVAANPAFALWTARRTWIQETLASIENEAKTETNSLLRFDQVIGKFVGSIDLPALAARDAEGEDVIPELRKLDLDLTAFRFLVRGRLMLVAGSLLDSEWQDVFAIALQVKKRRAFQQWRNEERQAGIALQPGVFLSGNSESSLEIKAWRGSRQMFSQWRRTLLARTKQRETLEHTHQTALAAAESQTLPKLRDTLLELVGQRQTPPATGAATAERLSRELLIDFRAHADTKTTRVDQAIETLQGLLFSVRAGRLPAGADGIWTMNEIIFDPEWVWMGSYRTWLAAIRVFAYPENQLFPNLYVPVGNRLTPTESFIGPNGLIDRLRKAPKVTPQLARILAKDYLADLRQKVPDAASKLPTSFILTDQQMSAQELENRRTLIAALFNGITNPNAIPQYLREVFWLVPMALAQRLQDEREYLVALDWYQTVYAFELPLDKRKRYPGLAMEATIPSSYGRTPEWLTEELNPHIVARTSMNNQVVVGRKNVYIRFTVMAIVRCFLAYADSEFSRNSTESVTKARTLYETAIDLLAVPELSPESGPNIPFPANPVWESLQVHAQNNLAKIHNGMNIAGVRDVKAPNGQASMFLPSQYRYAFLVERAKNLVAIAQQVETAFLSALQQGDEESYRQIQAKHDIQVASSSINLANLKVADAEILSSQASLQTQRSEIQLDHFEELIDDGLNGWESGAMGAMGAAALLHTVQAVWGQIKFWEGGAGQLAQAASATAEILQTKASFERREQDWQLQRNLAAKDRQIATEQILHAQNQRLVADQESTLANLQFEHAEAVMTFLSNKFTNAELFEWMSGVLNGVYAYFLQQATALAQLAEAQLAFERQEQAPGFVRADYWIDTTANADGTEQRDRRGLTGSARLLQDVYRLDQYAFDTDRRKLHLTQTLSLAQLGPMELQQLRDTGVLTFATPETLFDQEFPGHYLRLVKRVKVSLIALVPPTRGVRASLSASGLSRTVVAGDKFAPVTLSRSPESIAFTSPINATGLFDLEPENGMLLPFEGMGLDSVWRLELPKPANPFDYRTIADVLLTIEYTALQSFEYRNQVLRDLDRTFSGDRVFSVRDQFADAWYELNNPDQVEPARRMQIKLPIRREDFAPHLESLSVAQVTLFCVREDGFLQEVRIVSLAHTIAGLDTVTAAEVVTSGGVIGTRRPGGASWQTLIGRNPVGEWTIKLENTDQVRKGFKDGAIQDLALILTISGTTPAWPS